MGWQADLECKAEPVKLPTFMLFMGRHLECAGHWSIYDGIAGVAGITRHSAPVYWKKEENMLTDDWGFLIPSPSDAPEDFETGKLVCSNCGCYVHKDKRESHREKCNYV